LIAAPRPLLAPIPEDCVLESPPSSLAQTEMHIRSLARLGGAAQFWSLRIASKVEGFAELDPRRVRAEMCTDSAAAASSHLLRELRIV
jgi:hypothetical protein